MVSVIIVNYNTFKLTCNCIESIYLHEPDRKSYEIILVDNHSTENDPSLFKSLYSEITLVLNSENAGFAKGNNIGIHHAKGDLILLLNSDTVLINNAITLAANYFLSQDNSGVVSGKLFYEDGTPQNVAGRFPSVSRVLFDLFRLSKLLNKEQRGHYYLGTEILYDAALEVDWVWGAFFMFRKDDLKFFPEGKLHETFFMYYEDVQWCYHFKKVLRKKILFTPAPLVTHYLGKSDLSFDLKLNYLSKTLPNQFAWLKLTKGMLYARLYYFILSIFYFSLRKNEDVMKAKIYLKMAISYQNE